MRYLFSPWRSEYIDSFKEPKKGKECLLCRIAKEKNDIENLVIFRSDYCYAMLNRFPYNAGHIMIVPYRHISKIDKLKSEEVQDIFDLSNKCIDVLNKNYKPQGYNLGMNIGKVAGAGIDKHIHLHIVPRWNGDTNFLPILSETKMVSQELRKMQRQLKDLLK